MTQVFANIRSKYGDQKCLDAYAAYLRYASKGKSHSGPITGMSYLAMTGRYIAEESVSQAKA